MSAEQRGSFRSECSLRRRWGLDRECSKRSRAGECAKESVGVDVPARKTEEESLRGELVEVTLDLGEGSPVLMCRCLLRHLLGLPGAESKPHELVSTGPRLAH